MTEEEVKPEKKESSLLTGIVVCIFCLLFGVAVGIVIGKDLATGSLEDPNSVFVSNLTNVSIEKGFVGGFMYCRDSVVSLVNGSLSTCDPVGFNVSNELRYMIPVECLKNS